MDAYDDPNPLSDVDAHRSHFGIPLFNSNGHPTFIKVDQNGGSAVPRVNSSWSEEISAYPDIELPDLQRIICRAQFHQIRRSRYEGRCRGGISGFVVVRNSCGGIEVDSAIRRSPRHATTRISL